MVFAHIPPLLTGQYTCHISFDKTRKIKVGATTNKRRGLRYGY